MATINTEFPKDFSDNGTTKEVKDQVEHLTAKIGARVQTMLDGAQEKLSGAKDTAFSAASRARASAGDKVDTLGSMMQKHPIATIAIGCAAGYLLGRLTARR